MIHRLHRWLAIFGMVLAILLSSDCGASIAAKPTSTPIDASSNVIPAAQSKSCGPGKYTSLNGSYCLIVKAGWTATNYALPSIPNAVFIASPNGESRLDVLPLQTSLAANGYMDDQQGLQDFALYTIKQYLISNQGIADKDINFATASVIMLSAQSGIEIDATFNKSDSTWQAGIAGIIHNGLPIFVAWYALPPQGTETSTPQLDAIHLMMQSLNMLD
jgi:hypothetical protein